MSIDRTSYPKAAWSHQLRLNAAGCFEHYCEGEVDEVLGVPARAVADGGTTSRARRMPTTAGLIIDGRVEEGTPVDIGALRVSSTVTSSARPRALRCAHHAPALAPPPLSPRHSSP